MEPVLGVSDRRTIRKQGPNYKDVMSFGAASLYVCVCRVFCLQLQLQHERHKCCLLLRCGSIVDLQTERGKKTVVKKMG